MNIRDYFQDVLEFTLNCYYDVLRTNYSSPPENKRVAHIFYGILNNQIFARSFRYAAYRVSSWIIFGKLGKRKRKPLPACLGVYLSFYVL